MFSFCPHCGQSIDQHQAAGQRLVCKHCGQEIGLVATPKAVVVDQSAELIRQGKAARCPVCQQLVELRTQGTGRTLVPHYIVGPPRKICPQSGKPLPAEPAPAAPVPQPATGGKDLSKYMTREMIRILSCPLAGEPSIEELALSYLDKTDRVRLQIDALREILGPHFRMRAYPAALQRTELAVWGNSAACIIARKHPQGGYQSLAEAEIQQVLLDLQQQKELFFS